jgi:hypothetical protein
MKIFITVILHTMAGLYCGYLAYMYHMLLHDIVIIAIMTGIVIFTLTKEEK